MTSSPLDFFERLPVLPPGLDGMKRDELDLGESKITRILSKKWGITPRVSEMNSRVIHCADNGVSAGA